ncbi:hypothetical protein [Catellatospora coxensis]|uniref:Uncharacterized protein n=1 Tax=Catellatospora coxensis TaxID=310354 RepID=A0A8J3P638_9ACTN|nr:hypothetical protein [Catellatospora coxensis]GIG05057.1 hypothetical protein Cco03nite_17570 [Catellatospora coxensis]
MNFEPDADPDARRGEDVAAVIHLFARLASFDDTPDRVRPPDSADDALAGGEQYRRGVEHGRRTEEELIARIVAMAAGRHRSPVRIPDDAAGPADAGYRQGMIAGRRHVHEAVLVSHRMIHGLACPACAGSGPDGHAAGCRYG